MGKVGFGFKLNDKQHMFLCDEDTKIKLENKEYFNKTTECIYVYKGVECDDLLRQVDNEPIIIIKVINVIADYFGNKSGCHRRVKQYAIINGVIYNDDGDIVKKIPNEVRMAVVNI